MKSKVLLVLFIFLSCTSARACDVSGKAGIMIENNLKYPSSIKSTSEYSEDEFNQVVNDIADTYRPIIKERRAKRLRINSQWDNPSVNAYAEQRGRMYKITIYGGYARYLKSSDALALTLCHEMGHHLGGAPRRNGGIRRKDWASVEGQSDYWAALKCFRRLYEGDDNINILKTLNVDSFVKDKCEQNYFSENEIALCQRTAVASKILVNFLNNTDSTISFSTPSNVIANGISDKHPGAQCRLDTFFAATLCDKSIDDFVSNDDATSGTCTKQEGHTLKSRPMCWFNNINI